MLGTNHPLGLGNYLKTFSLDEDYDGKVTISTEDFDLKGNVTKMEEDGDYVTLEGLYSGEDEYGDACLASFVVAFDPDDDEVLVLTTECPIGGRTSDPIFPVIIESRS